MRCLQFIVQLTPISIESIGWRTYVIFAVLNSLWVPLIYLYFPETKGLELEDVDRLFAKGDALRALGGGYGSISSSVPASE